MQSRNETILQAIIDGADTAGLLPPQSRNEALLIQILDKMNGLCAIQIHICASDEYDQETGVPTIENPSPAVFYLVPTDEQDHYEEWIHTGEGWEKIREAQAGPAGNGIASVAKTGTAGLVDTYTITFTNGTTTTFTVTNAAPTLEYDVDGLVITTR